MIHPTAIVHPGAKLDLTVQVGPYAVIDKDVEIGPGCVIGPHAYFTGPTVIGAGNRFFAGCVIGESPQDLKYGGEPTRLEIGENNVFREHVTVHRSAKTGEATTIGSNNFLMAGSHVGHNCRVGNFVILANGALLGGHVEVADRAFISGNCLVHQFVRVGKLAIMRGGSAISKDLPPFTVAVGDNGICGLNVVGLRRAGFTSEQRLELKRIYRRLFADRPNLRLALDSAKTDSWGEAAREVLDFVAASERGVCAHRGEARAPE